MTVKLTLASELRTITQANLHLQETDALNSPTWKHLDALVTDSALHGKFATTFKMIPGENREHLHIFKKYYQEAGYRVKLIGSSELFISWSDEQ